MRYQHGDVILKVVNSIPKDAKKIDMYNGFIVEKGEGPHTHVLVDENIQNKVEAFEKSGILYLNVKAPIKIDHEEHHDKVLNPGIYEKDIETEWDYEREESRITRD